jgi:hypothetical protein
VVVYRNSGGAADEFGHADDNWIEVDRTIAVRSYANRNTTADENVGPLNRDRPIFYFVADEAPRSGDRIEYNGIYYELEAPTEYDSHTAAYANAITGFDPNE